MAHKWELFYVALLLPMLVVAVLAFIVRRRPAALPTIVRWAKPIYRILSYTSFVFLLAAILFASTICLYAFALLFVFNLGILEIEGWAEHKSNPDSPTPATHGWWPSKPY